MQFVSFALVCVLAVQAVFVSAHPAAGKQQVADKTVEQLHEEFIKVGTQLQTDLKNAHANSNLKDDTHAQAILTAVEEIDKKVVQLEKNLMDPKHPLSQDEIEQLFNDIKTLARKIRSEGRQLKPASKQPIRHILEILGERGHLLKEIAEKQEPNFGKKLNAEGSAFMSFQNYV